MTDFSRTSWCRFDGYLVEKLTGRLCQLNDDSRAERLLAGPDVPGSPDHRLALSLAGKDDDQNRPKIVQLDRRTFGQAYRDLPSTKTIGW
jgi:hypothetical protein